MRTQCTVLIVTHITAAYVAVVLASNDIFIERRVKRYETDNYIFMLSTAIGEHQLADSQS